MSGHSHWATVKRKKDVVDAKKGRTFSKIAVSITSAARMGGGDPAANARLALAMEQARAVNMPKDNIERAIKKGTGEAGGEGQLVELTYEAYGPGGVAILIDAITDNKNRTSSELRNLLENAGGSIGGSGSVNWMFDKKGLIIVEKSQAEEDALTEIALEGGAEDLAVVGDSYQITCEPHDFRALRKALEAHKIPIASSQLASIPKTTCTVDEHTGRKVVGLLERLEDHDDVQAVHSNAEFSEQLLAELAKA
jgi:YebC/PmpR family DNA-binding regulatory protein